MWTICENCSRASHREDECGFKRVSTRKRLRTRLWRHSQTFTERRPEIWKGTLDPDKYEVYEVADTSARVREGSKRPNVWAVERYEWAPGRVVATAEQSNFCKPGSGVEYTITDGADGGSHVELDWHREPSTFKGWMILAPMKVVGAKMLQKSVSGALDRYAETSTD